MNNQTPTQPPTKARGLRKYVPQAERYRERYGNFEMTPRDLEIIRLVYDYRHLEGRHIRALIGGSDDKIKRRLQGLFHNEYLARYSARQRMRPDLDKGSPQMVYGLERKGWRLLEEHAGAGEESDESEAVRWKKEYTRNTEWFLEHAVMRSNFRAVLDLALRSIDVDEKLLEWDQSDKLQVKLMLPGQRGERRLTSDAYFSIEDAGGLHNYFLEVDRATETQKATGAKRTTILDKFVKYWWFLQSDHYRKYYHDHQRVSVLFVTTGERRLANMMETLRGMEKPNRPSYGGKGWFRFCLEGDYQLEKPETILDPIWQTMTRSGEQVGLV